MPVFFFECLFLFFGVKSKLPSRKGGDSLIVRLFTVVVVGVGWQAVWVRKVTESFNHPCPDSGEGGQARRMKEDPLAFAYEGCFACGSSFPGLSCHAKGSKH